MGLFEALVLGIVQGITEFLPVSSSAHLVLVPAALGWSTPSIVFDTTVHLATLLAVVTVFWRDLVEIIAAWWRGIMAGKPFGTAEARLGWWVILGTIPGALAGVLFRDQFEGLFGEPRFVGIILLLTALLLVLAELLGRRKRDLTEINWLDSLIIGIGQAASIAPGLSRSGTTMAVGMFRGLTREAAARFSFILAVPIIMGAAIVQMLDLTGSEVSSQAPELTIGFLTAVVFGYIGIRVMLAYVRKRPFYPFAAYCVVIGILAIIFLK